MGQHRGYRAGLEIARRGPSAAPLPRNPGHAPKTMDPATGYSYRRFLSRGSVDAIAVHAETHAERLKPALAESPERTCRMGAVALCVFRGQQHVALGRRCDRAFACG